MEIKKLVINQYLYYALIGIVSFVCLFFLPFVGSEIGLEWSLPQTTAGWAVFVVTKGLGAFVNILIFHLFIQQAGLNVKDDPKYKAAMEMASKNKDKSYKPKSPLAFFSIQYGVKGTTVFLFSAVSAIALTQAILTFNWVILLSYVFTLIMGVVFGVIEMKKVELYWTTEFYDYTLYISKEEQNGQAQ